MGTYYGNDKTHEGGLSSRCKARQQRGREIVVVERFGETIASGGHDGGTGIAVYKDSIYAEINDRIVRYALPGRLDRSEGRRGDGCLPVR